MAKGNWNPEVVDPKPRCRICRKVVKTVDFCRLDGVYPAHTFCATATSRNYVIGKAVMRPDTAVINLLPANCRQELVDMEELDNQNYHHQINRIKEVYDQSHQVWRDDSFFNVWIQAHYK